VAGGDRDRADDRAARRGVPIGWLLGAQRPVGDDGPGPGTEVLRGEVAARRGTQIGIDVVGRDVVRGALLVHVREQLLAR
jgi:hypothetical protein